MRLRSASNRERSKYAFLPHGSHELSCVASAALRRAVSTALTPLNVSLWTLIVPSSLHAAAEIARAMSAQAQQLRRMRGYRTITCATELENEKGWKRTRKTRMAGQQD